MSKIINASPRQKMGVVSIEGTYLLMPLDKAMEVFSLLDDCTILNHTWDDKRPYKYSSARGRPTLNHISEAQLLQMDAEATLAEKE